jgi:5-methylcytosine-specific restriction endonuclease McrA
MGAAGDERKCRGCDAVFVVGWRERNPRVWCSGACRERTKRATAQRPKVPRIKMVREIWYGTCEVCGQLWCGQKMGHKSATCAREDCRKEAKNRRARAAYAADPTQSIERAARIRATRTDEERAREIERARAWRASAGYFEAKRTGDAIRRARKAGVRVEKFANTEVFDRDGWTCGICLEPIDPALAWPDPMSVSLDHVVPLSKGGDHSRANCQAAHLVCNVSKGDRLEAGVA